MPYHDVPLGVSDDDNPQEGRITCLIWGELAQCLRLGPAEIGSLRRGRIVCCTPGLIVAERCGDVRSRLAALLAQ